MRTPITYYGGKQQMLPHILPLIPKHTIYTESFAGGAAVFWAKEPAKIEVLNDLNGEIVNFYTILQTEFSKFKALVASTLHSREQYQDALHVYKRPHLFDPIRRAWAFWILTNQGFAAKIGSWGYDKTRNSKVNKLEFLRENLDEHYLKRIQNTQIENNDACKVILSRDSEETFHYVDPPYINSNQGHYGGYTEKDFEKLIDTLSQVKGKFLLSSYDDPMLQEAAKTFGWEQQKISKHLSASTKQGARKVEVLTGNFN